MGGIAGEVPEIGFAWQGKKSSGTCAQDQSFWIPCVEFSSFGKLQDSLRGLSGGSCEGMWRRVEDPFLKQRRCVHQFTYAMFLGTADDDQGMLVISLG